MVPINGSELAVSMLGVGGDAALRLAVLVSLPSVLLLFVVLIVLQFLVALLVVKKSGWDRVLAIILIPSAVVVVLGLLVFVVPVIPKFFGGFFL